ncbi:MAG: M12 family metallo-peptidase [Methanobacteriota archaeon]
MVGERSRVALSVLVLTIVLPSAAVPTTAQPSPFEVAEAGCVSPPTEYPVTGVACLRADGLLAVFAADGRLLGFTHGPDADAPGATPRDEDGEAVPFSDGGTPADTKPVKCVTGSAGTYFIQVIYARASDDSDRYSTMLSTIRTMSANANTVLNEAAVRTGGAASLKVKCVSGAIEVKNEVLPTSKNSDSYATIAADLQAKGYTDRKVKYWVFYDDCVGGSCGGQGQIENDDSLSASNLNNGNAARVHLAISYSSTSTRVWLHEVSHNMGAVQLSAPHDTGGWHCYDGYDILCYDDGGPDGWRYSTSWCAKRTINGVLEEPYDCGNDDYFHRSPTGSNYLTNHWNLGNTLNRFIDFALDGTPPSLTVDHPETGSVYVGCTEVDVGVGVASYVDQVCVQGSATDSGSGIRSVKVYEDNVLKGSSITGGSFTFTWNIGATKTNAEIKVIAENNDGQATATFTTNVRLVAV